MNKKLLSSLMAGLMLMPQGMSLSAKGPVSEFVKNNKTLVAGGAGLAGLAAGIAYLAHNSYFGKVAEMEFPPVGPDGLEADLFEKVAEEICEKLDKGKIVKISMPDSILATKLAHRVYRLKSKNKAPWIYYKPQAFPMGYNMMVEVDAEDGNEVVLTLNQTKRVGKNLALECVIEKSKSKCSNANKKFHEKKENNKAKGEKVEVAADSSDNLVDNNIGAETTSHEEGKINFESTANSSASYFADYSEADLLRDYSNPEENGLRDYTAENQNDDSNNSIFELSKSDDEN